MVASMVAPYPGGPAPDARDRRTVLLVDKLLDTRADRIHDHADDNGSNSRAGK